MDTRARKSSRRLRRIPIGTRYPEDRVLLLQSLQKRRGDRHLSDLIAEALDEMLERHRMLPDEMSDAAA